MAKFSKGQVVKTAKEIDEYGWKIPAGSKAKIVNVYGNGWYDTEVDGKLVGHSVSDAILVKNAEVVKKAWKDIGALFWKLQTVG